MKDYALLAAAAAAEAADRQILHLLEEWDQLEELTHAVWALGGDDPDYDMIDTLDELQHGMIVAIKSIINKCREQDLISLEDWRQIMRTVNLIGLPEEFR